MKLLFLDESGNHALDRIDAEYPVFVLGGVIVDRRYYRTVVVPRVERLKRELLGDTGLILHTADIVRTKNGFEALKDVPTRRRFYAALNGMMEELDYQVVACVIRKAEHLAAHGPDAADPYLYALGIVVERFCRMIGDVEDGGMVFAERRRSDLDDALDDGWRRLRDDGVGRLGGGEIERRIVDLSQKAKRTNTAGLELADLVVSPIGRHAIGKAPQEDWAIVASKLARGPQGDDGTGLVILP